MAILFFASSSACKAQQGISFFKGSYQQALLQGAKEKKMIFVDSYTTWCIPCKKLAAEIFPKKAMGDYFNTNFINIQVDMEKGIGVELAKKFGISSYPTLLIVNPDGYKVDQIVGYWEADTLLKWAASGKARAAESTPEMRFDKGERSASFIRDYFVMLIKNGQMSKARMDFASIIKEQGAAAIMEKKYFDLIALSDIDSTAALFLVKNRKILGDKFGTDSVDSKIRQMYISVKPLSKVFQGRLGGFKREAYQKLKEDIAVRNLPDKDFLLAELEIYVATVTNQVDKAVELAKEALIDAPAWKYYEMSLLANWNFQPQKKTIVREWLRKAISSAPEGKVKTESQAMLNAIESGKDTYPYIPTIEVFGRKFYAL